MFKQLPTEEIADSVTPIRRQWRFSSRAPYASRRAQCSATCRAGPEGSSATRSGQASPASKATCGRRWIGPVGVGRDPRFSHLPAITSAALDRQQRPRRSDFNPLPQLHDFCRCVVRPVGSRHGSREQCSPPAMTPAPTRLTAHRPPCRHLRRRRLKNAPPALRAWKTLTRPRMATLGGDQQLDGAISSAFWPASSGASDATGSGSRSWPLVERSASFGLGHPVHAMDLAGAC